jgi:acyl-CoA synthetase (AMP-forming)/AMP-acid ligase II/acyl carrier protein
MRLVPTRARDWTGTPAAILRRVASNLVELLTERASSHPTRGYTFHVDGCGSAERLSFRDLDRRARAIAARLPANEPVLILCPPGLDYIASFFGCLYAKSIATPAYPPDPMRLGRTLPRLRAIVKDTGARCVISTSMIAQMAPMVASEAPELAALEWIAADEVYDESFYLPRMIEPSTLAFLQYTSGSTSSPKGVMLTHANLCHNLEMIRTAFELDEGSRCAFWLPPYHDMGLIGGILEPLYAGGDCALMSPLDFLKRPMFWLETIAKTRADTSGAPNFAFDLCTRKSTAEERAALDLSSWTLAFNAAEPVRAQTMESFASAFAPAGFSRTSLYSCYGLAEATLLSTGTKRGVEPKARCFDAASLQKGRAIAGSRHGAGVRRLIPLGASPVEDAIRIVDPSTRIACEDGVVGEISVKSASVSSGYWNNDRATRKHISGDGRLYTGDLGFVHGGELFFVARIKDVVIIRGRNHYPQDIELAIEGAHPALRPGCGVALAIDGDDGEKLAIVWEVDREKARDLDQVVDRIRARVAERESLFADTIVLLEARSLPKTSSGKLQRQKTRADLLEDALPILHRWTAPKTIALSSSPDASLRDFLIERIASGLGMSEDAVDPDAPFTQYGLDSRMVVELASDLSERVGKELPATLAFNYPTINALTARLMEVE